MEAAWFVGIDWATAAHEVCVVDPSGRVVDRTSVKHDAASLQTFVAALEALPRYQHRGHFTAWMFQIARNKAMDHFRKDHNMSEMTDSVADPVQSDALEAIYRNESRVKLRALMRLLNDEERELLRLRFTAELSFVQIGQLLGRSEDAARKSIRRILDRLALQMEAQNA